MKLCSEHREQLTLATAYRFSQAIVVRDEANPFTLYRLFQDTFRRRTTIDPIRTEDDRIYVLFNNSMRYFAQTILFGGRLPLPHQWICGRANGEPEQGLPLKGRPGLAAVEVGYGALMGARLDHSRFHYMSPDAPLIAGGLELVGANLEGADFSGAILAGSNFSGAILAGSNFSGANLTDAILDGAFMLDAVLVKAILRRVSIDRGTQVTREQLRSGTQRSGVVQQWNHLHPEAEPLPVLSFSELQQQYRGPQSKEPPRASYSGWNEIVENTPVQTDVSIDEMNEMDSMEAAMDAPPGFVGMMEEIAPDPWSDLGLCFCVNGSPQKLF